MAGFNIENKYGIKALEVVLKSIFGLEEPTVPFPDYEGDFFEDVTNALQNVGLTADKDMSVKITKFLNRILGVSVGLQNKLFEFFSDTPEYMLLVSDLAGVADCLRPLRCADGKLQGRPYWRCLTICFTAAR